MSKEEFIRPSGVSPLSEDSRQWFLEKVKSIMPGQVNRVQLLKDGKPTNSPQSGMMYMFRYDPKGRKELPFYDKFPLVILVEGAIGGFEAINLHYLPIDIRQRFFYGGLLNRTNNRKFDRSTRFKVSYETMKSARSLKAFKPCYKKYLTQHIMGNIVIVPPDEWEMAIHMPTAQFAKATEDAVHKDSRDKIARF